jgi:hypothetical protein
LRILIDKIFQYLMEIPTGLLVGDRFWAFIRLMLVLSILLGFMCLGGIVFEQQHLDFRVASWVTNNPDLVNVPRWLLELGALFSTWKSWRYLIMPLASLIGAIFLGARYIQDIYNLKSFRKVLHYLFASLFDIFYPSLVIEDGKFKLKPGEENMVEKIGGPGNVIIRPGSVALFENAHNPTNTRSEGVHFLSRFEKVREKGSLEEQHGHIEQLAAVTKDGVRVYARDIHFRYRILPSRHLRINEDLSKQEPPPQENPESEYSRYRHALRGGRTPWVPYPYSIQAIRHMSYNRVVDSKGLVSWADTVRRQFDGVIKNYIRQNTLDQITAPRAFGHSDAGWELRKPRYEIHQNYKTSTFRKKFREVGAELLWYGIGFFEVADSRVNDQRVDTWRAAWQGDARKKRAYSEARRLVYEEQGRAEARAEILMGIIEGLDTRGLSEKQRFSRLPELLLIQVTNLLESTHRTDHTGTS